MRRCASLIRKSLSRSEKNQLAVLHASDERRIFYFFNVRADPSIGFVPSAYVQLLIIVGEGFGELSGGAVVRNIVRNIMRNVERNSFEGFAYERPHEG